MKEYKKVNISDSKTLKSKKNKINLKYNPIDRSFINILPNIIIILILFIIIVIYFLFGKKSEIKVLNKPINSSLEIKLLNKSINETLNSKEIYKSNNLNEKIKQYEKTLRIITHQEVEEFRKINDEGILFDRNKYKRSETPDISVVMTVHDQAHCVHKAIRSVQNQSLKNIEFIIVDDCSTDNSTETVEKYLKEDERIILLKHEFNEGVMVTRNEAIRRAKGKYITVLDPDDTLAHKDILNHSLTLANIGNLDIVEFWGALYKNKTFSLYIHNHNVKEILYQPELRTKFIWFSEDDRFRPIKCRTLWSKLIKNEIFQKALDGIPKKYLNDYILIYEDTMTIISLYREAQSFYNFEQIGYYYTFDEKGNKFPKLNNKQCKKKGDLIPKMDHVKFLNYLLEKLEDNEFNKLTIYNELKAMEPYYFSNFKRTITHHFYLAYIVIDDLLKTKYLTEKQKEKVIKMKKIVQENEKKFNNNTNLSQK